jgi:hypothetical protein
VKTQDLVGRKVFVWSVGPKAHTRQQLYDFLAECMLLDLAAEVDLPIVTRLIIVLLTNALGTGGSVVG